MMSDVETQHDAGILRPRGNNLLSFLGIVLGCLLILISFLFFNWNPPFTPYSHTPNPFLNGPGVFQDAIHYYGLPASVWLWITPLVAIVALLLACAGLLWRPYLLPLVFIPGSIGFLLLTRFVLTGETWNYGNYGYWLVLLGMLIILGGGLAARGMLLRKETVSAYNLILTYCLLIGGILVIASFFLPWLDLRASYSSYAFQQGFYHYKGFPVTGAGLAYGFFPSVQQFYRQTTPEVFWLLWLIPLTGLISVITASVNLHGYHVSYWFRITVISLSFLLLLILLYPLTNRNVTLYGFHIELSGLVFLFVSSLFWKEIGLKNKLTAQQRRRMIVRRSVLGGFAGLVSVAYLGYISWRTSVIQNILVALPAKEDDRGKVVAWAADSKRLAVIDNGVLQIWDAFARKQLSTIRLQYSDYNNALAWSPDQRFIATSTGGLAQVFEVATGKLFSSWATDLLCREVSWSSDSRRVATTGGGPRSLIEIHDVTTRKVLQTFGGDIDSDEGSYRAVSWSPDNRYLAASGLESRDNNRQSSLRIWEVSSNKRIFTTYYAPQNYLAQFSIWSPDETRLATLGDASGVNIWGTLGGTLLLTYTGTGGPFFCLAWSPDGKYIASGDDNVVRVWNTTTGETVFSYLGHQEIVQGISWSPQGNYIASTSNDGVRIWRPF